jgi:hypothetical protein
VGDCGSEHLEEVILEFELLIFNNMGDAPCHDHLVRPVLKQYLLLFEGQYFFFLIILLRRISIFLSFII